MFRLLVVVLGKLERVPGFFREGKVCHSGCGCGIAKR